MTLDKKMWQEAVAQYRAWNDAKFAYRVQHVGERNVMERWREYCDLMSFGMKIKPESSARERRLKMAAWERY